MENIKGYECEPAPISKPSRLRRREINVTARIAGNTTEETVNVKETNPDSVEETEPAENTENDIEKCTVEKGAVVAKCEAAKDFKIDTNTAVKTYLMFEKCGKYLSLIPALPNQFTGATRAPGGYQTAQTSNNTTNLTKFECDKCK